MSRSACLFVSVTTFLLAACGDSGGTTGTTGTGGDTGSGGSTSTTTATTSGSGGEGGGVTITPVITSLAPTFGIVTTEVTVTGTQFGATAGTLTIDGITATTTAWSDTSITFDVPLAALPGTRDVVVTRAGVDSNAVSFRVALPRTVYLNNDDTVANSVSAYAMDAAGALTPLVDSPFDTGAGSTSFGGDASSLYLDRERRRLFASNADSVAVFDIDGVTGALTAVTGSPFTTDGTGVYGLTATRDGQFLFTAQYTSQTVGVLSVAADGALASITGSPYAASDVDTLQLVQGGKFLTATDESNQLLVFAVDPVSRELAEVTGSPFAIGDTFTSRTNPAATRLYVPDGATNSLEVYDLDSMTGEPTPITGSPFLVADANTPHSMAFRPDGAVLYLGDYGNENLNVYAIGASGAPTPITGSPFPIAGVGSSTSMGVTRDGTFLVVESKSDDVISVFALDAAGKPTAVTNSPFAMDVSADASGLVIAE